MKIYKDRDWDDWKDRPIDLAGSDLISAVRPLHDSTVFASLTGFLKSEVYEKSPAKTAPARSRVTFDTPSKNHKKAARSGISIQNKKLSSQFPYRER